MKSDQHTWTTFICARPCRSSRRTSDLAIHGSTEGLGLLGQRSRADAGVLLDKADDPLVSLQQRCARSTERQACIVSSVMAPLRVHKLASTGSRDLLRAAAGERRRRQLYVTPEEQWRRWSSGSGSGGTCAIVPPVWFSSSDCSFWFCHMLSRGT
jgi:hypothetical protein